MDLLPNPDQRALLDSLNKMLRREFPVEATRWKQGASDATRLSVFADFGCYGLGLAEAQGGSGLGPAEEALLFADMGRHLTPPGALAGVLAARLAAAAGSSGILNDVTSGRAAAALCVAGAPGSGACYLVDAAAAPLLVHVTQNAAWLLPAAAATRRVVHPSLDETVTLESARLNLEEGGALYQEGSAITLMRDLLVTALLVGLAESALTTAVGYAKIRQQFEIAIGTFQAIKHPLANAAVRADASRWQCMLAALVLGRAQEDAAYQIKAAFLVAAKAAAANAALAVQVHGGMGYTAECTAHFHVKRAQLLQRFVGGSAFQRDSFLELRPPPMVGERRQNT